MNDSQRYKWVNISYILFSGILGYIVFSISNYVALKIDLEAKVKHLELIIRGFALFVSLLTFVILSKHRKVNQYMHEVVVELSRVTWPSGSATISATWVVVIMVLISGFILGALDYMWTILLGQIF